MENEMEPKSRNVVEGKYSLYAVILILGIMGGVLGSYAFLSYKGIIFTKNKGTVSTTSSIKVEESSAVIDAVRKVNPAVVSITGTTETLNFFGNATESQSAGTGYIVAKDGLIVTNKHVVSGTNANYSVFTSDGKEYKATIKSLDPTNDIAILKIDASNLPIVEFGDSNSLQVGQRVVAIGNALGQYQNSVTTGIVSGIGRAIQAGDSSNGSRESLENVIQTDAAINPGNSGGPLVNLEAQVIGMNTAVDQSGQSIGFAIPINVIKSAVDSYLAKGKIVRPMLGVRYISITKEFATRNNLKVNQGAYIYGGSGALGVVPNSPADKAGLKEGDIITKIGNTTIDANHSLTSILTNYNVGDKVTVQYITGGKTKSVDVTLAESN